MHGERLREWELQSIQLLLFDNVTSDPLLEDDDSFKTKRIGRSKCECEKRRQKELGLGALYAYRHCRYRAQNLDLNPSFYRT